ncbi:MAG: TrlF family AAA-like ATPase, partial [Thermoanaerobaculia bacterium]
LGVTDYFCIRTYKRALSYSKSGRLGNIRLLFPNVEMRLTVETKKGRAVNLHLLFSPDDPDHVDQIERILRFLIFNFDGRDYCCSETELIELGRAFDPKQTSPEGALRTGANQFKVDISQIRKLLQSDSWFQNNCLIAVAGGLSDGTSGLQEDSAFAATRQEIERLAHIIFASTPSQREFWLGKASNSNLKHLEERFGGPKACLHGSDAHTTSKVGVPDLDRFCWVRGDLTFETLRQVVIEPEERCWIGGAPPPVPVSAILRIEAENASWFKNGQLDLNPGLVAIIGARGSGKTALLDMVATGAKASGIALGDSSFLRRAMDPVDYIGNGSVKLDWADGVPSESIQLKDALAPQALVDERACYLSQQFVDRLCSSAGLGTELRREMERVVFEATPAENRLETSNFDELSGVILGPIRGRRSELQTDITRRSIEIIAQESLRAKIPRLAKECGEIKLKIQALAGEQSKLIPKGKEERAKTLAAVETAYVNAITKIEGLRRKQKVVADLRADVAYIRTSREPDRWRQMTKQFSGIGLSPEQWTAFILKFSGDVDAILDGADANSRLEIERATTAKDDGSDSRDLSLWSLERLTLHRDELRKTVGIDEQMQRRYEQLRRDQTALEVQGHKKEAEAKEATEAEARRAEIIDERRADYARVFDTFRAEEVELAGLYGPLSKALSSATGALNKLTFVVRRKIDVEGWVSKGERLLDLRKASRFQGRGALRFEAEAGLLPAWRDGSANDVAKAMDSFRSDFQADLLKARPGTVSIDRVSEWQQEIASWLYDTGHIQIEYGVQYDGVPIEQLSPGTRGIVLLLLFLVLDRQDTRPLIIDQPEENLDPQSVYQDLVPHFREARKRRQIIMVTHNANLVINTDADQIFVAAANRIEAGRLPDITYESGSIESPPIRRAICDILEGGERAFREREKRYRIRG